MPEDSKPADPLAEKSGPSDPIKSDAKDEKRKEIGDFITRHVLEKDSIFFEG
jgi:hypothetical protein